MHLAAYTQDGKLYQDALLGGFRLRKESDGRHTLASPLQWPPNGICPVMVTAIGILVGDQVAKFNIIHQRMGLDDVLRILPGPMGLTILPHIAEKLGIE